MSKERRDSGSLESLIWAAHYPAIVGPVKVFDFSVALENGRVKAEPRPYILGWQHSTLIVKMGWDKFQPSACESLPSIRHRVALLGISLC